MRRQSGAKSGRKWARRRNQVDKMASGERKLRPTSRHFRDVEAVEGRNIALKPPSKHAENFGMKGFWMSLATPLTRPRISFRHEAPWMRLCARAVLTGWLLPLLFALFTSLGAGIQPASAQDVAGQTVVVLDFATPNGTDPLLGRKAADALAVELQRTGEFSVVSRQRLLDEVGKQAGLQPPFNDTAQIRLGQALGASSVFSGEIAAINVVPGQSARARIVVRQLDATTGDYINGTQNIESTEQKLTSVANEILVDEAINKSAFSAVRSLRQTNLPSGNVLNTTLNEYELSIGTRNGVGLGQRYSVLRDIRNETRGVTERLKIGEVTIRRVEADQSTAVLTGGGLQGVRTGDRVRQIFTASQTPISLSANSVSSNPVSATPPNRTAGGGIARSKGAKGLFGLLALAGLGLFAGLGGGGSNSSPTAGQPYESDPTGVRPTAALNFSSGFTGVDKSLQGESVVAYLIYRGTSASFSPAVQNLQAVIDARSVRNGQNIPFSDPLIATQTTLRQKVVITATASTTGATGLGASVSVNFTNADVTGTDNQNVTQSTATFEFTQRPLEIGTTFYYRIGRITAARVSNNTTATVNLALTQSPTSTTTGGYTPLLRPLIVSSVPDPSDTTTFAYNLSNFSVRLNAQPDIDQLNSDFNYTFRINSNVATGVDIFRVQVSTSSNFSESTTFTSADTAPTTPNSTGDVVLNFGQIQIPNTTRNQFSNGTTTLFIRALSRRSTDAVEVFRVSPTITIAPNQVTDTPTTSNGLSLSSRFLKSTVDENGVRIGRRTRGPNAVAAPRTHVGKPRS